jgi:RNA polymerase sigma factor (TIGR02999 family)
MQEDTRAHEDFQSELYAELRRRASILMRNQPRSHTLQATALVNEVYLRLHGDTDPAEEDRAHFLALASRAMRHVLVDHARTRGRQKRTPQGEKVALDDVVVTYESRALDLLALDDALQRLSEFDEDMARAVELRFFGGLSVEETARVLGIPKRTLERRWQAVRAWLHAEVR